MWNLENNINEYIYKTEIDSQIQKTKLWLPGGEGIGEGQTKGIGLLCTNFYK